MPEATETVVSLDVAAETRRRRRRAPAEAGDTLRDVPPAGFLTRLGWEEASPEFRAERILSDAEKNIADAACALHAGMVGSPEQRDAALRFIAVALRREAQMIGRARRVLHDAACRAGEARGE